MISAVDIDLVLQNDNIVFHGPEEYASSKLLFGKVILKVRRKFSAKSLKVYALGTVFYSFVREVGTNHYVSKDTFHAGKEKLLDHCEVLFDNQHTHTVFAPGVYEYDFFIKLNGDLPETINTQYGCTDYILKASLNKSPLSPKITKQVPIYIKRISTTDISQIEPSTDHIQIEKKFEDKLSVKISTDSKHFSDDQIIKVNVELLPINPDLKVETIGTTINEYITIRDPTYSSAKVNYTKLVKTKYKKVFVSEQEKSETTYMDGTTFSLDVEVPQKYKKVQFDIENDIFQVYHSLNFFCIVEINNIKERLTLTSPITIVPKEFFTEYFSLPRYTPEHNNSEILPPPYSEV
ncbi:hypothetical protein BB559_002671 [Furculomyces boomerangus]|uniref:Uncharacterized protein n=2 Tax=Harpellales TaxID=61421 RepID=A0A2T9YTG5_9FUNG|nr:hypothetical protein BB559_002671 [Furculomyces boomerangus]PWA02783.1 hypothetical protein BB558_001072 [Smittium angustum]